MKTVNTRKNSLINNSATRMVKRKISTAARVVADKIAASVERDRIAFLSDEVERLQLKKDALLGSLEAVSVELYKKEKELQGLTVELPLDVVPA